MMAPQSPTPAPSRHTFSGMIADRLTALLAHCAQSGEPVTACELRDQLLKYPELETADSKAIYLRARDRLRSLKRQGLAQRVGVQGKHRPVYQIIDLPADPVSSPGAPAMSASHGGDADQYITDDAPSSATSETDSVEAFADFLSRERHRLKLEMNAALGEANHYGHILQKFPERHAQIEPLHDAALRRGGELKGALDAVVTLHHSMADKEVSS
ncbi:hypothetical protein [Halomonas daqiaonensis]|uniref:Uncharacterized protein n=1 Tax=Halomonas daqiaonensis TaxID=650850 RepID=A0A1H7GLP8_9GAMM|nr:hypothetical protein [Halomonas daqiaonensis]SEK38467.1 hypothetical protein SAMN04488129_1025 [Halomonas daqiaonensis]